MTTHARLSPSSSDRWIVCQQSLIPVPEDLRIDDSNEFALDGSAKHALSEWCLKYPYVQPIDALLQGKEFFGLPVTMEMVEAADVYVSYARELMADHRYQHRWFEERVYMPDIDEEMYGTLDFCVFSEQLRHVIIGDAKFGWNIRQPNIWQLRCYAVGKVRELEDLGFEVERITCFICQPSDEFEPVKDIDYTRKEVKSHARQLKKAKTGNAAVAGDHCKYCPRAHFCSTLEDYVQEAIGGVENLSNKGMEAEIVRRTPEEVAEILDRRDAVKVWFGAVASWAEQLLLTEAVVPEYYMHTPLGHRAYRNPEEAEKILLEEFGQGIYEERKLRSPAKIEKIWKKDAKLLLNGDGDAPGLTHRPKGTPELRRNRKNGTS